MVSTSLFASSLIIATTSAFGPNNIPNSRTLQLKRHRGNHPSFPFTPNPNVKQDGGAVRTKLDSRLEAASVDVALTLEAIDTFWQTSPYTAAAIVCGVKASAADLVVQNNQLNNDNDDAEQPKDRNGESSTTATNLEVTIVEESETQQQTQPLQEKRVLLYNPNFDEEEEATVELDNPELDVKQRKETVMLYDPNLTNEDEQVAVVAQDQQKLDLLRTFAFLMYGSVYQGACQEFIYNHLYPAWFGDGTEVSVVLTKVIFDCLIQTTLVTLPVAYLTKALIYRYSFEEAFRRYISDIQEHGLLIKYYSLWFPVNCLTFSVIPEHYRVTWIALVSFFWLMILSSISSKQDLVDNENECTLIDAQTCKIDG